MSTWNRRRRKLRAEEGDFSYSGTLKLFRNFINDNNICWTKKYIHENFMKYLSWYMCDNVF